MIKEFQGEYRWLSNFTYVDIELDGEIYPSIEHAYMSAKSNDTIDFENDYGIIEVVKWKDLCADRTKKPGQIKKLSRKVKLVHNWETKKFEVMEYCLKQKFSKEPFKSKLLATGTKYIQEGNFWNDKIWGVDLKTGKGDNRLGKMIMAIRNDLQKV